MSRKPQTREIDGVKVTVTPLKLRQALRGRVRLTGLLGDTARQLIMDGTGAHNLPAGLIGAIAAAVKPEDVDWAIDGGSQGVEGDAFPGFLRDAEANGIAFLGAMDDVFASDLSLVKCIAFAWEVNYPDFFVGWRELTALASPPSTASDSAESTT